MPDYEDMILARQEIMEIAEDDDIYESLLSGGYFGTSDREIFYYEEDERGYGTMNEADRKTEPRGYCNECKWYGDKQVCGRCRSRNLYAPKTEPTEITYQNCSDALLKMWMDNVLTDGEYNRIMEKLNKRK